jgi:hypothetical protein
MESKESHRVKYNTKNVALLTFTGCLGGISVGYNCGIVAGACLYMDEAFPEKTSVTDKSVSLLSVMMT